MPISLCMCLAALLMIPVSLALDPTPPPAPPNSYWTNHGGLTDSCPYQCNAGFTRSGSACVAVGGYVSSSAQQIGTTPTGATIQATAPPSTPRPGVYLTFTLQYDSETTPTPSDITTLRIKIATSLSINSGLISIKVSQVARRRRLLTVSGYVLTVTIVLETPELANAIASQVASSSFQSSLSAGSAVPITFVENSAAVQVVGGTTQAPATAPATAPAPAPSGGGGGGITAQPGTTTAPPADSPQSSNAIIAVAIAVPVVVIAAVTTGVALYLRQPTVAPTKAQPVPDPSQRPIIPVKIDRTTTPSTKMAFAFNP